MKNRNFKKDLVIGAIIALIGCFAVLIFVIGQLFFNSSDNSSEAPLVNLEKKYQDSFNYILSDYTSQSSSLASLLSNDFLVSTKKTKGRLLELVVPTQFKQNHLTAILLLSSIEEDIDSGEIEAAVVDFNDLKGIKL